MAKTAVVYLNGVLQTSIARVPYGCCMDNIEVRMEGYAPGVLLDTEIYPTCEELIAYFYENFLDGFDLSNIVCSYDADSHTFDISFYGKYCPPAAELYDPFQEISYPGLELPSSGIVFYAYQLFQPYQSFSTVSPTAINFGLVGLNSVNTETIVYEQVFSNGTYSYNCKHSIINMPINTALDPDPTNCNEVQFEVTSFIRNGIEQLGAPLNSPVYPIDPNNPIYGAQTAIEFCKFINDELFFANGIPYVLTYGNPLLLTFSFFFIYPNGETWSITVNKNTCPSQQATYVFDETGGNDPSPTCAGVQNIVINNLVETYISCDGGATLDKIEDATYLSGITNKETPDGGQISVDLTWTPTTLEGLNCILYFCESPFGSFCCKEVTLLGSVTTTDFCIKRKDCHTWSIGNAAIPDDYTVKLYDMLGTLIAIYTVGVGEVVDIPLPTDGIYVVQVNYGNTEQPNIIYYTVFEFCDLFSCVNGLINDLWCKEDICCENCDNKEDEKRRHEINKILAAYWSLTALLYRDSMQLLGMQTISSTATSQINNINSVYKTLKDLVNKCGSCKGTTVFNSKPCKTC